MPFEEARETRISKWTWVRVPAIDRYIPMHELDDQNLEQLVEAGSALLKDRELARVVVR